MADEKNIGDQHNNTDPKQKFEVEIPGKRQYDIVVLGASGFTGKRVVIELARMSQKYSLTWAVAGRNDIKLQEVLDNVNTFVDDFDAKQIGIINATIENFKSLEQMASITSVLINCVGPYYIYGEVVVKACISNRTHYVDVTGESLFMETMVHKYNSEAEKNNVVIASALGMESVPADLGVEYLYQKFNGDLQNIDIYMKLYASAFEFSSSGMIHVGTWASAIIHFATANERVKMRQLLDESIGITTRPKPNITKILHKQEIGNHIQWCVPFPEPDQAVIARSLHHAKTVEKRNINFEVRNYMVFGYLISAIIGLFVFVFLSFMSTFTPLKNLFIRFPRLFSLGVVSNQGPTERIMENSRMSLTLIGRGTTSIDNTNSKKDIRTTIARIKVKNPGYGFTSKAVVLGAVTLIKDNITNGGVLTPASAFRKTDYMKRLIENDAATFEIISETVNSKPHTE
ncbi:saccharopine dehydrogenase-like oxidoreductase [Adelges cooleyi]|uniref:saccharopine dehydrogenase-like oxidoreductase n=1 Tax=Adelges cooleyi TaxID=133065 RepID=UPI0021805336|nr:saccharopine dehydrogenase-like oxidoreductase [Adelges cooleyi]XP_050438088.1 saccharopine dehydrogenase-like oxidoreductase [Adelges cooleyi]XP_050438089.1 saccharopine dehydrogenase-like oxidoreductase [Adelges cooleyi]